MRSEQCVCGGTIRAPSVVTCRQAVEEHNATMCHQLWRAFREGWFLASAEGPTVRLVTRDLSESTPNASAPAPRPRVA